MPRPRKQFGQHWLQSDKALSKILAAAELQKGDGDHPGDRVLEIGPGKGILTRPLVQQAATVVSVEIDRDLCELLAQKMGQLDNFLLLQGDFLTLDVDALLTPFPQFQQPNKVVANIPYNITGPILEKLLGTIATMPRYDTTTEATFQGTIAQPNPCPFESIVLLVQREVALRLRAQAGSTHFGALSVRVQYLATCELICDVPAKAFRPPPKVDSAVIRLRPRSLSTCHSSPSPRKIGEVGL